MKLPLLPKLLLLSVNSPDELDKISCVSPACRPPGRRLRIWRGRNSADIGSTYMISKLVIHGS
jgi:hypothetical protein